jgi:hypothetical protein
MAGYNGVPLTKHGHSWTNRSPDQSMYPTKVQASTVVLEKKQACARHFGLRLLALDALEHFMNE